MPRCLAGLPHSVRRIPLAAVDGVIPVFRVGLLQSDKPLLSRLFQMGSKPTEHAAGPLTARAFQGTLQDRAVVIILTVKGQHIAVDGTERNVLL